MADESDLDKTESATPKRLQQAREEGNVARSRELTTFAMLVAGFGGTYALAGPIGGSLLDMFHAAFTFDRALSFDPSLMLPNAAQLLMRGAFAIAPVIAIMIVVAIAAPMAVSGWLLTPKAWVPNFSRLNPMTGLGRMFSMQGVTQLLMALAKSIIVGGTGFLAMRHYSPEAAALITETPQAALPDALHLVGVTCLWVVFAMLLMVVFDVPYQIWHHRKQLRMTKEEVKREFKENEGDPRIKARIRQQQRELARRRMMAQVPKADVIVTNPTHYAVALQYVDGEMRAPRLIAKGSNLIAARIREIGAEHNIPLLEAPPLARALYHHTELNHEIPASLYGAVAEILAWVYQLRRWNSEGGTMPVRPLEIAVPPELDSEGSLA